MKYDYCSNFPETWRGKAIGETCCKKHDNDSGGAGSWNFYQHQSDFYKCLKATGMSMKWVWMITAGGTMAVIVKMPYLVYLKLKRKGKL